MSAFAAVLVSAFDASKFRTTCAESPSCAGLRPVGGRAMPAYRIDGVVTSTACKVDACRIAGTAHISDNVATAQITDGKNGTATLVMHAVAGAVPSWTVRIESASNHFRIAPLVLPPELTERPAITQILPDEQGVWVLRAASTAWWSELEVHSEPLALRLFVGRVGSARIHQQIPAVVLNSRGLLQFGGCSDRPDAWGGFIDSRPHGCTAYGADVFFPGALEAFGLPERAEPLALPITLEPLTLATVSGTGATDAPLTPSFTPLREPHRLFNLDVFKYGPGTPVGLYGSLPFLLAHGRRHAAGALWLSAAETYVDLWREHQASAAGSGSSSGSGAASGAASGTGSGGSGGSGGGGMGSYWQSEGGAMEVILFGGPSAGHVLAQLVACTGTPPLPPLWALGYHQSHWNIRSQAQVEGLDRNFDRYGVPLDAVWIDIEHTLGKRYFTFDGAVFPEPEALRRRLSPKGRRLVGIADPHLKADADYELHRIAAAAGLLVTRHDGSAFVGECWPGKSSYLDLLQPKARALWSSLYVHGPQERLNASSDSMPALSGEGSTAAERAQAKAEPASSLRSVGRRQASLGWPLWMHAWNDMNEPSVFDEAELTLPRDALHRLPRGWDGDATDDPADAGRSDAERGGGGGDEEGSSSDGGKDAHVEHRLVHNAYGTLQARATFEGMRVRPGSEFERPFVLSRAFFVGSQRYGAVWTGDNSASWEHLRLSFAMVLSLSLSGMPFTGADVGGFFGTPEPELLSRWYQAAAYLPFFRGHAHLDSPRREPFLLPAPYAAAAADAIRERQRLLPYWYTLFWEASEANGDQVGLPIVAPPWLRLGVPQPKSSPPLGADGEPKQAFNHVSGNAGRGGTSSSTAAAAAASTIDVGAADRATQAALRREEQWMVGGALLVQPVAHPAVLSAVVELPAGGGEGVLWYEMGAAASGRPYRGGSRVHVPTPLDATPRFQLGGTIVPRRERVRRSALLAVYDPLTLHVAPDATGSARGRIFLDDGVGAAEGVGRPSLEFELTFSCALPLPLPAASPEMPSPSPEMPSEYDAILVNSTSCTLRAAPTYAHPPTYQLPRRVHVETILLRGTMAADATAVLVLDTLAGSATVEHDVRVRASAQGLLLTRMQAPMDAKWTVRLDRGGGRPIWPEGLQYQ